LWFLGGFVMFGFGSVTAVVAFDSSVFVSVVTAGGTVRLVVPAAVFVDAGYACLLRPDTLPAVGSVAASNLAGALVLDFARPAVSGDPLSSLGDFRARVSAPAPVTPFRFRSVSVPLPF